MADYVQKLLPRFRYGVILPRAHEEVQRSRSYQLYRLLPLDFMEISTGLGLERVQAFKSSMVQCSRMVPNVQSLNRCLT